MGQPEHLVHPSDRSVEVQPLLPCRRPRPFSRTHHLFLTTFYHLLRLLYIIYITLLSLYILSALPNYLKSFKPLPNDPRARALRLLETSPIIDGHIDLPILARAYYRNQIGEMKMEVRGMTGQVDLPRLREGKVGGFFWSTYIMCPEDAGYPIDNHRNFTTPTHRVRDTLEQIDVARLLIDRFSDTFELTLTASAWRKAMKKGKIGGMLGVEGGHQLGSSLSTLRTYYALGARYVTLTHTCHNALADSCGMQGTPIDPRWNGLSSFGRSAIKEMNRLGMMVDLSHTSPQTASQALSLSQAPVIFSHSNARGVHSVVRNVPDSILRRIGRLSHPHRRVDLSKDGERGLGWGNDTNEIDLDIPGRDALIMLNFSPAFISETEDGTGPRANVSLLADHADYIGRLAGREHIGIGSDFDGIAKVPEGLEDVSFYPDLLAELLRRGWSDEEVRGVASENLLRILEGVEKVKKEMKDVEPLNEIFEGRDDMKGGGWERAASF